MHVRTVTIVALQLLAVSGCDDRDPPTDTDESSERDLEDDEPGDVLGSAADEEALPGSDEQDHCDDQTGEVSCLAAGCRWQSMVGAMRESDDSCSYGEPLGLCFAESFAQPCEPAARRCADGAFAWVLPGPDNAVVLAYSASSCGLPDHFMPCPIVTVPQDLRADLETPPRGADDLDAVALTACACACEGG